MLVVDLMAASYTVGGGNLGRSLQGWVQRSKRAESAAIAFSHCGGGLGDLSRSIKLGIVGP